MSIDQPFRDGDCKICVVSNAIVFPRYPASEFLRCVTYFKDKRKNNELWKKKHAVQTQRKCIIITWCRVEENNMHCSESTFNF